jgi:hypothetical protein
VDLPALPAGLIFFRCEAGQGGRRCQSPPGRLMRLAQAP